MRRRPDAFRSGVARRWSRWLLLAALAASPAAPLSPSLFAQAREGVYGAEAVRAALLVNFIRFTEWPASALPAGEPFVIGVAGDRALEHELVRLAERQTVLERRLRIVRVNGVRNVAGCHVLYVGTVSRPGEDVAPGADELLPAARGAPVLTVSDSPTFLAQGGIVNLYVGDEGKLRFEIAPRHATEAGLKLSSRLLALARIVNPPARASE